MIIDYFPFITGLGIAMTIPMSICNIYYNTIIIWTLYYLGNSFMSPLPWTTCENSWSSEQCISDRSEYQLKIKQQNGTFNNNLTTTYSSEWQNESNVDRVNGPWLTSQEDFWQWVQGRSLRWAASVKNICQKKYIKTIKLYFHVLNKGTINKLTD